LGGALATLVLLTAAQACNVPVFRFALERWQGDSYQVVVFHRGPLSLAQREEMRPLEDMRDQFKANVVTWPVDVASITNAEDRELYEALGDEPSLPCIAVQYPAPLRITAPVWSAPLSRESVARLTDSAARQEIVRRLVAGHTAVWLLVESGDAVKDKAAAEILAEQLPLLEEKLKLPDLTASPDDALLTTAPLKMKFSVLRLSRKDMSEEPLVQMLLQSEPDLAERNDAMVFPVFGRGRALLGLVGVEITANNLYDCAAFLVGACSCEVKAQNPGFDLLLAAEWDALLFSGSQPESVMTRREALPATEPVMVPIPSGAKMASTAGAMPPSDEPRLATSLSPTSRSDFNKIVMLLGGGGFALTALLIAWLAATKRLGLHNSARCSPDQGP
jgi:hypothetical protein